jgi:hypothetical protein
MWKGSAGSAAGEGDRRREAGPPAANTPHDVRDEVNHDERPVERSYLGVKFLMRTAIRLPAVAGRSFLRKIPELAQDRLQ